MSQIPGPILFALHVLVGIFGWAVLNYVIHANECQEKWSTEKFITLILCILLGFFSPIFVGFVYAVLWFLGYRMTIGLRFR